ncbi:hypothetical protein SUGI_0511550 [Cryptomeria japonica]|uniref:cyclic dof factor 2 n=1 Tax=Cryptomeria japonica TaxID=3369 RepID=UPI00240894E5|nr:cyclic dof factor 2 [Cryptomeria japonica]GLJ26484.1 hypothetical protein SUGI_0511550 [Cryptomeria japonica]
MSEEAVVEDAAELLKSDPAFKLFGRRIPVLSASSDFSDRSSESADTSEVTKNSHSSDETKSSLLLNSSVSLHANIEYKEPFNNEKNFNGESLFQTTLEKPSIGSEESIEKYNLCDEKPNRGVVEMSEESIKKEDETPKKPSKLLPCPRCESMDTKFCYYNNYNVNQPRHFCRNCQRYWTAGGLLRNVPVGAGRRKNKHSAISHQRDLGHANDCNSEDSMKFELSPLEMASPGQSFSHAKKGTRNHLRASGGLETSSLFSDESENLQKSSCPSSQMKGEIVWNTMYSSEMKTHEKGGESVEIGKLDDSVCASSKKLMKSDVESSESNNTPKDQGVSCDLLNSSMSWVRGPPPVWPLYCGSFFGNSPFMNAIGGAMLNPENFQSSSMLPWFQPGTGLYPGFAWPFPSGPMWGQASWAPAWGMPLGPVAPPSTSLDSSPSMLGKHTRDLPASHSESKGDGSIWVPKTLRIDDPEEAAKSSIWATLGLGSKSESITTGGIFKAFQPKMENKDNTKTDVRVLWANPAASARSASFNESN